MLANLQQPGMMPLAPIWQQSAQENKPWKIKAGETNRRCEFNKAI
jgi:hypothetical protein